MNSAEIFYSFPRVIDLSLSRMKLALAKFEINHLAPIIHIAGTNGKGSTTAFLRAILEKAGKLCHVYTSPHLVTIHERFVIASKQITEKQLLKYAQKVKEISQDIDLTIFEAETLAAFLAFSQKRADYILLETGLGGRLDATNAIEDKAITIITPIDYDHGEFLGNDIKKIAAEKCGILRKNTPAIIAAQRNEVFDEIQTQIEEIGAIPFMKGVEWDSYPSFGGLALQTQSEFLDLPPPSLFGLHQFENAGLAARAALVLGIPESAIAKGIKSAYWPARLQIIKKGKFAEVSNHANCELWLDGGHNPHGARAASAFMAELNKKSPKEMVLICAMLANKDEIGFFKEFQNLNPKIFTIPITTSPNGQSPNELCETAKNLGFDANAFEDLESAIKAAAMFPNKRILICGSLYLAGDFLAKNNQKLIEI